MVRASALRRGGWGSIPGRVIPKTIEMGPNSSLLGAQGWIGVCKTDDMPHEDQPPHAGSSSQQDATVTGFTDHTSDQPCRKMDGMVIVQKLSKKTATVVTVRDLSGCFNDRLMQMTQYYDEIILVFDKYRADSLKSATGDKRRKEKLLSSIKSGMTPTSDTSQ